MVALVPQAFVHGALQKFNDIAFHGQLEGLEETNRATTYDYDCLPP
jgi:hypothetical protein